MSLSKRGYALVGVVLLVAVVWMLRDWIWPPRGGATTVRITIGGLATFVPDATNGVLRVALPDARDGAIVERCPQAVCTPATVKLPKHAAMIVFDRPEPGAPVPGNIPWILIDEEIEISVSPGSSTSSASGALDHLGELGTIQPAIGTINPMITSNAISPGLADVVVARLRLSGGTLEFPTGGGIGTPVKYRALVGAADVTAPNLPDRARVLQYVIEGDSVDFVRKRFSDGVEFDDRTLRGGEFEVFIGNVPTEHDGGSSEDVFHPAYTDTHFYWNYDLAASPLDPARRLVPVFSGGPIVTATGPRCMMARY